MTEAVAINNEELAVLSDIVAGPSVRAANLNKRVVVKRLVAAGFVKPADESAFPKYQHTAKAETLFAQLCVGVSGS
jgi:hypothetical protein